jgi:CRP/FNR family transcriptional regulator, cyclic AMP receptor protein
MPNVMDIVTLFDAMQSLNADDAFKPRLTLDQWRGIQPFLARQECRAGELLMREGEHDRTMYFLERGTLQVFTSTPKPGGGRLSILRAGSVVGEAALFSDQPRMANVEAMTPCAVWAMRGTRFDELAARSPTVALELARAVAAVMGQRMRANIERGNAIS